MVRRRSTVRFRNGAPGHGQFSNDSDERRGPSPGDALQLPLRRKLPLHSESPVAVTEGSRRRAVPGQSGQCPGEVTLGRSSSGRAVQASMSGIKILGPPGGCWCHPARRSGGLTSGWGMAASPGWAATSEAKMPGPPVHAVRVRDVLQLDGLSALLGALRTCRSQRVLRLHADARPRIAIP